MPWRLLPLLILAALPSCQGLAPQQQEIRQPTQFVSQAVTPKASNAFAPALRRTQERLAKGFPSATCNEVLLLEGGREALSARLHLIANAQQSIDYQTFIWVNDEAGWLLAKALIRAAERGVKVRILVDYIGIAKDAKALGRVAHAHPNLEVKVYRPTGRTLEGGIFSTLAYVLTNFKGANQRMHHKVVTVDDQFGITGGRNVENSYFDHALSMNFKDRDALVVGPIAKEMRHSFDAFWSYRHAIPALMLTDVLKAKGEVNHELIHSPVARRLSSLEKRSRDSSELAEGLRLMDSVQFISDLPGKNGALLLEGGGRATTLVLRALAEAESDVWIQSPYLVLGRNGRTFFRKFRKKRPKVAIHISTNSFGSTDNLIAYAGNVRLRDRYVHQFNFHIHEYRPWPQDLRQVLPTYDWLARVSKASGERPPFLCVHAKSFVVDDKLAFVGTFNLDPRSAHLNTECGLIIRDRALAQSLKREIQRDLLPANSWAIAPRALLKDIAGVQMASREITDLIPVNITLLDGTTAFELKPGKANVLKDDPNFYLHFRDIGSYPGSPGILTDREFKMRLLKFSTPLLDPLL